MTDFKAQTFELLAEDIGQVHREFQNSMSLFKEFKSPVGGMDAVFEVLQPDLDALARYIEVSNETKNFDKGDIQSVGDKLMHFIDQLSELAQAIGQAWEETHANLPKDDRPHTSLGVAHTALLIRNVHSVAQFMLLLVDNYTHLLKHNDDQPNKETDNA